MAAAVGPAATFGVFCDALAAVGAEGLDGPELFRQLDLDGDGVVRLAEPEARRPAEDGWQARCLEAERALAGSLAAQQALERDQAMLAAQLRAVREQAAG